MTCNLTGYEYNRESVMFAAVNRVLLQSLVSRKGHLARRMFKKIQKKVDTGPAIADSRATHRNNNTHKHT